MFTVFPSTTMAFKTKNINYTDELTAQDILTLRNVFEFTLRQMLPYFESSRLVFVVPNDQVREFFTPWFMSLTQEYLNWGPFHCGGNTFHLTTDLDDSCENHTGFTLVLTDKVPPTAITQCDVFVVVYRREHSNGLGFLVDNVTNNPNPIEGI